MKWRRMGKEELVTLKVLIEKEQTNTRIAKVLGVTEALQTVTIEEDGKRFAIRTECRGNCGKIFQAVGVALPPTIREIT